MSGIWSQVMERWGICLVWAFGSSFPSHPAPGTIPSSFPVIYADGLLQSPPCVPAHCARLPHDSLNSNNSNRASGRPISPLPALLHSLFMRSSSAFPNPPRTGVQSGCLWVRCFAEASVASCKPQLLTPLPRRQFLV